MSRIGARFLFGVDAEELVHGERELFRLRETFNRQLVRLPHWAPAPMTLRIRRQQAALGRRVNAVLGQRRAAAPWGWVLFALAGRPDAQERIAAEAACLPDDPGATAVADLDALEFTAAFVREVLRVRPPTWLPARTVVQDTELGGYALCPTRPRLAHLPRDAARPAAPAGRRSAPGTVAADHVGHGCVTGR